MEKPVSVHKHYEIFLCHAPEDTNLRDTIIHLLKEHRAPDRPYYCWYENRIELGDPIDLTLEQHLRSADLILILVTPNLKASKYWTTIVPQSIERYKAGGAMVTLIMLQPDEDLEYESDKRRERQFLANVPLLPTNGIPLASWPEPEKAYKNVGDRLEGIMTTLFSGYTYEIQHFNGLSSDVEESFLAYEIKRPATRSIEYEISYLKQELEECREALSHDEFNASLYTKTGLVLCELGNYTEALWALKKATKLNPQDAIAHLNAGWAQYELNQMKGALRSLDKATQLSPESLSIYRIKLKVLYRLKRFKEIEVVANRALELGKNTTIPILDEEVILIKQAATYYRQAERDRSTPVPFPLSGDEGRFTPSYVAWKGSQTPQHTRRQLLLWLSASVGVGVSIAVFGEWAWLHRESPPVHAPQLLTLPTRTIPPEAQWGLLRLTYRSYQQPVNTIAWSPNGIQIASGYQDDQVQVWNARDGSLICRYQGHKLPVWWVTWSPDGTQIASASWDGTVQVWNAVNGTRRYTYTGHSNKVRTVAWSPDGMLLASGSFDQTVQIWQANNGRHVLTYSGHTNAVGAVAWSPVSHSYIIASGSDDKTVQVWNAITGKKSTVYTHHTDWVGTIAWSPDGKRIVSGSVDRTVRVWEAARGNDIYGYRHSNEVWKVGWSLDGRFIASASSDETVQIWDAMQGQRRYTYEGNRTKVRALAWSPNSQAIASGGFDGKVQIWTVSQK